VPNATLPAFLQERWFSQYEFMPGVASICASGAYPATISELAALEPELARDLLGMALDYADGRGSPDLRQAVAAHHPGLDGEDVLITCGASEAILLFALAAFGPGVPVVVEEPMYGSYRLVAEWLGADVRRLALRPERGWVLEPDALDRLVDAGGWAVLNPFHNPTGAPRDTALQRKLLAIASRHGARLVADEVFRPVALDGEAPLPLACLDPTAVSIGDVSKPWGLGGLRVGWIASRDRALLERCAELRHYTTLCGARPAEGLAAVALRHADRLLAPRLERARLNRARLDAFAAARPDRFWLSRPVGGYSAFLRLGPHGAAIDAEALGRDLVRDHGLLVLPGGVMGDAWRSYVRLGLNADPEAFARGLAALDRAVPA
jgi:aspartate/methionine/tyrosine aminotransferase